MRLIDADNVNFHCNYDGDCTGDIYSCKKCENYVCDFRDIQEQQTAYDIDKVVEELNELDVKSITRYKNGNFGNFDGVEYYIKKRKAIEIVKQGGVADDVCEWKLTEENALETLNNAILEGNSIVINSRDFGVYKSAFQKVEVE